MITCNIKGGLGNFMFQIAAMESLAKDNNEVVYFPNFSSYMTNINNDTFHNPKIDYAQEYTNIFKNLVIKENVRAHDTTIEIPFEYTKIEFKNETNYSGFFQSEKFFKHNRKFILYLFEPRDDIKCYIENKYEDILKLKTCAIHVRRGDYAKLQHVHTLLDIDYYDNAMKMIENVDKYIVFSDDIEWCKQTFKGDKFFFVSENRDYHEMFLMARCHHQIIANSSFSWWPAWLNNNPHKKIVGPTKWFNTDIPSKDILADEWIKI